MEAKKKRMVKVSSELAIISPQATLNRGYAMILDDEGGAISSEKEIQVDSSFEAVLKDGRLKARRMED